MAIEVRQLVTQDRKVLSGAPVFAGTRVPLRNLIDYLGGGDTLQDFLEDFPSVSREQAIAVLDAMQRALLDQLHAHPSR